MKTLIFILAATITSVFFINFCNAIFRCGCASLWNSADAHCNIHVAQAHHCPWCAYGPVASTAPWILIVAVQSWIAFWPSTIHAGLRFIAALTAFPLTGALLAAAYGLATGYWK